MGKGPAAHPGFLHEAERALLLLHETFPGTQFSLAHFRITWEDGPSPTAAASVLGYPLERAQGGWSLATLFEGRGHHNARTITLQRTVRASLLLASLLRACGGDPRLLFAALVDPASQKWKQLETDHVPTALEETFGSLLADQVGATLLPSAAALLAVTHPLGPRDVTSALRLAEALHP